MILLCHDSDSFWAEPEPQLLEIDDSVGGLIRNKMDSNIVDVNTRLFAPSQKA